MVAERVLKQADRWSANLRFQARLEPATVAIDAY